MRSTHRLKRCVHGAQDDFYNRRLMKGQAQPSSLKEGVFEAQRACMTGESEGISLTAELPKAN
jgi:hypothetical protein